tara:strand:- start:470 stop:751 length:282 start_codon:yes stop_codon:yes gene_type:complete
LSKKKLIKQLQNKNPQLNQSEIENVINIFFDNIHNILKEANNLEIRGLGRWYFKTLNEKYNARNPRTGETIYVPKRIRARFKASKKLKEIINL